MDQFAYTYNAVGNRLSITRPEEKVTYSYDLLDRLTQATPTKLRGRDRDDDRDHQAEAFTYDPVGNRLTGPNPRTAYAYNAGNQLTSDGRHQFTYDRNGNLTQKTEIDEHGRQKVQTFSYDDENRLVQVTLQGEEGSKTVRFRYDPFGNRIEKRVEESEERREIETATHTYVYDNQAIILEKITSSEGDIRTIKYLQGPGIDEPLEVEQKGKVYFYQADALGSVTALTDERQKMVEQDTYASFGELKQQGDRVKNSFTFTGREWDEEIGLYYYRARYYDAGVGRFSSVDPITRGKKGHARLSVSLRKPRELHPFIYVENNPINLSDPFGLAVLSLDRNVPECAYYSRTCASSGGKCRYDCFTGPTLCNNPSFIVTLVGVPEENINCIRTCLIREDNRARSNPSYFKSDCPKCLKNDVIDGYHIACFSLCGVATWRYPGILFLGN